MQVNDSIPSPDTADIVLFAQHEGLTHVLLVRRADDSDAFAGHWALPGGFVDPGETALQAATRELGEETGLTAAGLTWVGRYDAPGRDPRGRVVSEAFTAVLPQMFRPTAGDDASAAEWIPLHQITRLAFDHNQILTDALNTLDQQKGTTR
ncbi:NUDIX hydrolase [Saccharopolyspora terrae]|uniref:NUDIX hydrolase n=1 Tax=Saccharopolyspora terrae TaxID=2530384 RepID=A0A4R4VZS4_9PSEU|nr:NUDIX hydrolase [Saccharopolyspora terrae]TDD08105.1 NUDIX hydrolase [Saccharopolyspora terrae]